MHFGSYQTSWAWLHKLRVCMIALNRKPFKGEVEVDETYIVGVAPQSAAGRSTIKNVAVTCAVEKDVKRCDLVRLAVIPNASAEKLKEFLNGKFGSETTVHTDGWRGYDNI